MKAIWEFLNSLKLTVYLVLAIVAVTMFGSFVLYFNEPVFGDMDQTLLFRWLATKGLETPGLTWWLYVLVGMVVLLGVNTMVCTVERLPLLWRRYKDPLLNLRDVEPGGAGRELAGGDGALERLKARLPLHGYAVFSGGGRLYAEKNRWVPFMPYLVHVGMMVFMLAHLVSGLYGYRNSGLFIFQGDTAKSPGGEWYIRVDEVKVDYRADGSLKDYGSRLTAIKDGREVKTAWVSANMPMFVLGGAVYQRQFGQDFKGIYLSASVPSSGYQDQVYLGSDARLFPLGETGYSVLVERFLPDAAMDASGTLFSRSEELGNPAVKVRLLAHDGATAGEGWLFANNPAWDSFKSNAAQLRFAGLDIKPYAAFEVNRDPGALTALLAACVIMLGCVVTLYFRRERVWASVDAATGRARVICTDDEMYEKLGG